MQLQHLLASLALALPLVAGSSSMSTLGCYSDVAGLTSVKQFTFQTHQYCIKQCAEEGFHYAVLKDGATCGCTGTVPLSTAKVDDDKCNSACAGWPEDECGGKDVYTVLTTNKFLSSSSTNNTESANSDSGAASDSNSGPTSTAAVATTNGGIIIAATNAATNTVTGASTMVTKGITSLPSPSKSSIPSGGITALSSSATPTPTSNAADSLRAAPMAGAIVAGLGLLL
ncbi:Carbohydrate-binding WSC subgroup [Penicillium angulare]|uniref:Carbohydrate-binding WSC subgroup n=1 Tax=Penicillium angulare TaxID=116970 RepID=A0A9W9KSG4_9EURO|nr:Carbohydrate-binding WSC subgroup [Penicillium angulare]